MQRRSVLLISSLLLVLSSPVHAERSASLHNNALFEDRDNLFLYPGLLLRNSDVLRMDMGGSEGLGNGLVTWSLGDYTLGFAIHRNQVSTLTGGGVLAPSGAEESTSLGGVGGGVFQFPEAGIDNIKALMISLIDRGAPGAGAIIDAINEMDPVGGLLAGPSPSEIVDLMVGFPLGSMDGGLRVAAWSGTANDAFKVDRIDPDTGLVVEDDNGDPVKDDKTRTANQTGVGLTFGLRSRSATGTRIDSSASLSVLNGSSNDQHRQLDETTSQLLIGADVRAMMPMRKGMDLGILGGLRYFTASGSVTRDEATTTNSEGAGFGMSVGVGPLFTDSDGGQVGFYGVVSLLSSAIDPDTGQNNDRVNSQALVAPGLRAAAEFPFKDWLKLRAGLDYTFGSASTDTGGNTTSMQSSGGSFAWSAGFGASWKRFQLDGTFNHACLLLACDDGLMTTISGTYFFGDPAKMKQRNTPRAAPKERRRDEYRDRDRDRDSDREEGDREALPESDERRDEAAESEEARDSRSRENEDGGRRRMRR